MTKANGILSVALSYLGFSVTDGALRVLVVLYFHNLGFSPFEVASLFLLYEVAGIFTNFLGGWIGSVLGLNVTLITGMLVQVISLALLTVENSVLTVPYIIVIQGFSGIAKDLVKISSKSSLKVLSKSNDQKELFKWVSLLTGSKNSLKGVGFLLGGFLLTLIGFQKAMGLMSLVLFLLTIYSYLKVPKNLGSAKNKIKVKSLFSKTKEINFLSAARFFLFGSRDIWFVVALPIYLELNLGWEHSFVGAFLALWIVGYGVAQTLVPKFISADKLTTTMNGKSVFLWSSLLVLFPMGIALLSDSGIDQNILITCGLFIFGLVFAVNSIIHSYLVLVYSKSENVSVDVGFYYMANACGRLVGTLLSGWVYQTQGFIACLWYSVAFLVLASIFSFFLPKQN